MVEFFSMAVVFDGREFAKRKEAVLKKKFRKLAKKFGRRARLVSVLVGDNLASRLYLRIKKEAAERIGVEFEIAEFEEKIEPEVLVKFLQKEGEKERVDGLMVQLPLPSWWSREEKRGALEAIVPEKDVDGLTSFSQGKVVVDCKDGFLPATVLAVWQILLAAGLEEKKMKKKTVCILGRSDIVGKPLANLLINRGATVIVCGKTTSNLSSYTRVADIVVSATGRPGLVKEEMIKEGAVVVDVGEPRGDVDFEEVKKKVSFITPVPGGVGPVTVVCLFENLLRAFASRGE